MTKSNKSRSKSSRKTDGKKPAKVATKGHGAAATVRVYRAQKLAKPIPVSKRKKKAQAKKPSVTVSKGRPANHPSFIESATHSLKDLRMAKKEWTARLLLRDSSPTPERYIHAIHSAPNENVTGVGIAEKFVEGKPTGIMAVKFLVRRKHPESSLDRKNLLPKSINGLPVDVEEMETFRALRAPAPAVNPRSRIDPAQPGSSIGFRFPGTISGNFGTFGALVRDSVNVYILSNNHVLAFENSSRALNTPIFQPGPFDRDPRSAQIATVENLALLDPRICNRMDCAIAKVTNPARVLNSIIQLGPPRGFGMARVNMPVHKFGCRTGNRAGIIRSVDFDVRILISGTVFAFCDQIMIEGDRGILFADEGDSGALVLERDSQIAVGLLMGRGQGRDGNSFIVANHLEPVLRRFNLRLV